MALIVFWGGVWLICIVAIALPTFQQRELQKTLREIISRGQALDAATVQAIMGVKRRRLRQDQAFMIAGICLGALGLGMVPMSWFIGRMAPEAAGPILGGSVVLCLLSAAMLLIWKLLERERGRGAVEDA